jgi:ubiquinol-cytochrome c reductase core subunit 2
VKAGSRFETKPGVAHALKNFAFKDTATRSALRTVREAELYGGVLSSTLGREHLALTAEFLPGDEAYFVEVLANVISSTKFTPHEFNESVSPSVQSESAAASTDPVTQAIDLAHSIAFRSGLGSSLLASPHSHVTLEDVKSFASSVFNKDNIVVLGTGIDSAVLSKLVKRTSRAIPPPPRLPQVPLRDTLAEKLAFLVKVTAIPPFSSVMAQPVLRRLSSLPSPLTLTLHPH